MMTATATTVPLPPTTLDVNGIDDAYDIDSDSDSDSECGDGAVALAAGFPRQHQGRCNNEDKVDGGGDDMATVTMEATVSDDEHGDISNDHNANHNDSLLLKRGPPIDSF